MGIRQLRARLERAALRPEVKNEPITIFPVDPTVALALREPLKSLEPPSLSMVLDDWRDPDGAKVRKEARRVLTEQVTERIRAIGFPTNYPYKERRIDADRQEAIERKHRPENGGVPLSEAEESELAQIAVRRFAYSRSVEVLERARIAQLNFLPELSAEEQAEFDQLQARYHAQLDPLAKTLRAWARASLESDRANPPRVRRR